MTKISSYLFSWDEIPGNDRVKLIDFLKQNYSIEWVITAKIKKIDDNKTIKVYLEKKFLTLKLNDEKTVVDLKINDGRADKFIVKMENGKLNVYNPLNIGLEIIKVLSDSKPRNQNEITESINLNKRESKDKNMVRRALHKLESYLEAPKIEDYKDGKFWTLKTDKETIRQIILNYPGTILHLQKNETIISKIVEKDKFGNYAEDVRDLLRLSPTFFKNYLVQEMFLEHFEKVWMKLSDIKPEIYKITNNIPPYMLFEAFRHSVINDTIEGKCNEEAIEYIRKNESWFSLMKIITYDEGIITGMNVSENDTIDENAPMRNIDL